MSSIQKSYPFFTHFPASENIPVSGNEPPIFIGLAVGFAGWLKTGKGAKIMVNEASIIKTIITLLFI
jgi:hypothetical protein